MFKRSFDKFLNQKPKKADLYPYLYSIAFQELGQSKEEVKQEPIKCSYCGAIFLDISMIKEDETNRTHYVCEFCGTINKIDKSLVNKKLPDDVCYVLSEILLKKPEEDIITKVKTVEGELYISVIDISGSMSGAKIEAVKKSLVQTIKDFKINSPKTKFLLIAFESSVYYYIKHDQDAVMFSGDLLFSLESMKAELNKSINKDEFVGSIGEFADGWIRKIESLRSRDMTALGPALYFAILSFEKLTSTGRITLLTDGLANQGIGNLSGSSPGGEQFYDKMAELCNEKKIVVDVVGVSQSGDNNEMGLEILGKIPDKTGGTLYFISSEEMGKIFSELRHTRYIGKDVKVKIFVHPKVSIKNITGAYSSKGKVNQSEINLGAITADRELYVELDSSKEFSDKEEIPIQLQVEYVDIDGTKKMRVITDRVKVTKDENEFKSAYNQRYNVTMNIQSAGSVKYKGGGQASKKTLKELRKKMQAEVTELKNSNIIFAEEAYAQGISFLNDELDEIEMEEKEAAQAPAKSYWASRGHQSARMSSESLKKRSEKKKKGN